MTDIFGAAAEYAETVTVREGDTERTAKAFIQPESVGSPDYESRPTAMGLADDRRYLIIAERTAFSGSGKVEICCGDRVYELLRRELLWRGSHWEGHMRLKGGNGNVQ